MQRAYPWLALLAALGCGSSDDSSKGGSGGQPASGGAPGLGGTGGLANSSGGAPGAGGGPSGGGTTASGGFVSTGGASATGGAVSTGGVVSSGGTVSAGGAVSTGGATANGGASASGGATGSGGAAPVTCPATQSLEAGETTETISVGGTSRRYILHVPPNYSGQAPVPLVVDFHPILTDAAFERGNSGYAALADQEGFVVAYPYGIDNAWNVGPCCTTSRTVDDVGFAKAVVDAVKAKGCIDPKRVYAVGYSMGGGMSHYVACHAADVFAAVSPAAFDLLTENEGDCKPPRPITVMSFRGTADPIVPYNGGASNPPNGLPVTIHFLGAQGTFQKWAEIDGCTGSPTAGANGCSTYSQCQGGVEVTLCTAQGGGHVTGDAKSAWAMLKKHPMP